MKLRALVLAMCFTAFGAGSVLAQSLDSTQPPQQPPPPPTPRSPAPSTKPAPPPQTLQPGSPAPPPPPPAPRREGQPVNIKVDVTITDQRGGTQALKKTVTVVTGDSMGGFIRSTARYGNIGDVPLNVDTEPVILSDGKMRVRVNLQYDLPASPSELTGEIRVAGSLIKTQIHESLALILENGKSVIAAQSADPVGDRQVTIEVKATILR